jgi:hypothetical protein
MFAKGKKGNRVALLSFRPRFGFAAGQGRKADTARDGGLSALLL